MAENITNISKPTSTPRVAPPKVEATQATGLYVEGTMKYFDYSHLPPALQQVSKICCECAEDLAAIVPHNSQFNRGLEKLLEAKDCFVRANL